MDSLGPTPTADKMDSYEPIKVLGEGSFGKVYLMRHRHERKLVCVKVIKIKNIPKKERDACKMEVDLLKRLRHPNIVGYRDSFLNPSRETLCIVMQVVMDRLALRVCQRPMKTPVMREKGYWGCC